ncbi:MAG: DNA polymerase I [Parcubacteria group bacterium]
MKKKLILIDGNALVHRAFHALPPLTGPSGMVTNAAFGFSSILIRTIKDLNPDYIVATFDLAGPTFRHEEFAEYKEHRVKAPQELYDQLPIVKDIVKAFGIPIYEKQGFEADDVIGTIVKNAKKEKDTQIIVATGDLDTLQLVDGTKVIILTMKRGMGDTVIYDDKAVKARYGLRPDQMNDFKGLKGDPSDNIPGVPGIGEKTATALIQEFGTLDNLYKKLESKTGISKDKVSEKLQENLREHKDQAMFSKQLSTIVTDVDIKFSMKDSEWRKRLNRTEIENLFRQYGFSSLMKRLDNIGLGTQATLDMGSSSSKGFNKPKTEVPLSQDSPEKIATSIKKQKEAAFHMEQKEEKLYGCSDGKSCFVLDNPIPKPIKEVLNNPDITIIGHDVKQIVKHFIKQKIQPKKFFDTMIAAYMLNLGSGKYELSDLCQSELGKSIPPNTSAQEFPIRILQLKKYLDKKLQSSTSKKAFEEIELPLIPVLADMELNGIKIDTKILADLLTITKSELSKLERRIYKLAGSEFNINSPQQLGSVLFENLKLKTKVRKTSGGALSTAAPELEKIRDEHPIIDPILQYRELQKLKTTYIEPFPEWIDEDERIHTTYNQTGTVTGRFSSKDPNLQNIPVRTELGREFRKAFIPERGYRLLSFDYSQIDLRIAAHVAGDKKMIRAFKNGEDIHTRTAMEVLGITESQVTKDIRRQAKVLNFGILYGMGVRGFARTAGVDQAQAREFMDKYFAEFSGIAEYMENTKNQAYSKGYVETIFGHRRYFPNIDSGIQQLRAQAERMAINMPIQGTAADIVKLAMIKVYKHLQEKYNTDKIRTLLQVHDELVFEVQKDIINKVAPEIKAIMEKVYKLDVPLIVDIKQGTNWKEMKPLE